MSNKPVLLVVENEVELGNVVTAAMQDAGYELRLAKTADEALASLRAEPANGAIVGFDIDIDGGGAALAQQLKALRPGLPVVLLSSAYRPVTDTTVRQLGVEAVLSRPLAYYELAETLANVLAGRRHSVVSRSSSDIPVQGSLEDYPFESLLFKLFDSQFTGRLLLSRRKATRFLYMLRGFPCAATSNTHAEALGSLLVNRGLVSRESINAMLGKLQKGTKTFGQQLVEARLITPQQLDFVLEEQVRERVLSCFELRDGNWEVHPGDSFIQQLETHVQNPIELLYLGISRFEETNTLAERVQQRVDHYAVPTRNFARLIPYFPMGENRAQLFSQIDGSHKLGELFRGWKGDLPAFFRIVWAIHAARLIFLSPSPLPTTLPPLERLLRPSRYLSAFMQLRRIGSLPAVSANTSTSKSPGSSNFRRDASGIMTSPIAQLIQMESRLDVLNHFELFDLSTQASAAEIRTAIDSRVKTLDPKTFKDLPAQDLQKLARVGRRLRQAAGVLLDPDARERYRKEVAPGASDDEIELARALLDANRLSEALELLTRMESRDPANPAACALLGRALHLSQPNDPRVRARAEALLHRSTILDEANVDGHFFLACLRHDTGETKSAIASLERALEFDPNHPLAKTMLQNLLGGDVGLETQKFGTWLLKEK